MDKYSIIKSVEAKRIIKDEVDKLRVSLSRCACRLTSLREQQLHFEQWNHIDIIHYIIEKFRKELDDLEE